MGYVFKINGKEVTEDEFRSRPNKWGEIAESGCAPGLKTSTSRFSGQLTGHSKSRSERAYAEMYKRKRGHYPDGKTYKSSLARYAGDPAAWVGSDDDVTALCKKRGWTCPSVGIKRAQYTPEPEVKPLGEDIIQRELEKVIESNPGIKQKPKKIQEQREAIVDRMSSPGNKALRKSLGK